MPQLLRTRLTPAAVACALAGLAAGCGREDGIRAYRAPRDAEPTAKSEPKLPAGHPPVGGGGDKDGGEVRFLGAIIPAGGGSSYFVRLLAPADRVDDAVVKQFDALLNSIRVPGAGGRPISWDPPPGAVEGPARPVRVVTYTLAPGVDVYISDPLQGSALSNVNRWRTDFVGLPAVAEADLPKVTTEVVLGGTKALRVDFRGSGGKGGGRGPFQKGG